MKKATWLLLYGVIFTSIIIIDRLTKIHVKSLGNKIIIPHFFSFHLVYNRGISWSLFYSENPAVFWGLTLIIALFIILFFLYTYNRWLQKIPIIAEVMVLAGALSNLLDRILYGGVIDFIVVSYYEWAWPIFNIADVCIVTGLVIMIFREFCI